MYTTVTQWTQIQKHSEAATAWERYSYKNTRETKTPLVTKQKAARLMYTIDTQRNHSQQHSESVTA